MNPLRLAFITGLLVSLACHPAYSADLQIRIQDIRNTEGVIQVALYDNKAAYESMSQSDFYLGLQQRIAGDQLLVTFHNLPAGKYAVSHFHDENSNSRLDEHKGIPLEGYGVSNARHGLDMPSFDKAAIDVQQNNQSINIKTFYAE